MLKVQRSLHRYERAADDQAALVMRMKEIASIRVRYGYRRIHILLEREGWKANHKRVYRLYKKEGLQMRNKIPKRRVSIKTRIEPVQAARKNEVWSMDFVSDELYTGQRIRTLTMVDAYTRESPAIEVGIGLRGYDVVRVLERAVENHGMPKVIKVDNGPEFISKDLDLWAYTKGVRLEFSRPGKPTDNAYIESFNSRFRQECLNQHWFLSLEDAKMKINEWWQEYNESRPHSSLGYISPRDFAQLNLLTKGFESGCHFQDWE